MQLFVYEHLCATTPAGLPEAASLRTEGWAMLRAVLDDFGRCPAVRTVTLLEPGFDPPGCTLPEAVSRRSCRPGEEEVAFRALARAADFTLVIAPELDGLLYERCRWVEEEGGRLLGPSSEAVRLTGDKLGLAEHLRAHGVSTPPTVRLPSDTPPFPFPLVCKPRHGAGSQATFLPHDADALEDCMNRAGREGWTGELVAQPYIPGQAASVAFLRGPGGIVSLPAAAQRLSGDGRFRYLGGSLPLRPDLDRRARFVAEQAVLSVEGLWGYFGVDVVLGAAGDGSEDAVIEINPRLTTSYVGLRRLATFNLAEALLATATGRPLPEWRWRGVRVHFDADGTCCEEPGP